MRKDTPNFIGNRIGIFALMNTIRIMQAMDLTIEQVDALTGSVLGWPKTGTFRLERPGGIDVWPCCDEFLRARAGRAVRPCAAGFLDADAANEMAGRQDQAGLLQKERRDEGGEEARLGLDWKTLEYRPSERAKFPALELAKNAESLSGTAQAVAGWRSTKDQAAAFYWQSLPELWNYAAYRIGEIADDIVEIDSAMKTGFNWEMGPFEMWDAAGVPETAEKMRAAD